MSDEELLADLSRASTPDDLTARADAILARASHHIGLLRHADAIALLDRARQSAALPGTIDRMLACALGGRAELMLRWANALEVVPPSDLLEAADSDLQQAIAADPHLGDPHWDLAVIDACFRGDRPAAQRHLEAARRCGYMHPAMPQLESLIAAARVPLVPEDGPAARLRALLLRLALQSCGPLDGRLADEQEPEHVPDIPRSFGDYLVAARMAVATGLSAEEWRQTRIAVGRLEGGALDWAADLLRRTAEAAPAPAEARAEALHLHLGVLQRSARGFIEEGERTQDRLWYRRARRAAERALMIVGAASVPIQPDLHADLLLDRGSATWRLDEERVIEVLADYREALRRKRQAGNDVHVTRLEALIWRQIESRRAEVKRSLLIGGFGEAVRTLTAFVEAAEELADRRRTAALRIELAGAQRSLGFREEAEQTLRRVLAEVQEPELTRQARFELASVCSETERPAEALAIHEALIAEGGALAQHPMLWANYANDLLLLRRLPEAAGALARAWDLLREKERRAQPGTPSVSGAFVRMLQARVATAMGRFDDALDRLKEAAALNPTPHGTDGLHQLSLQAEVLLAAGRSDAALESLDRADAVLRMMLARGPDLDTWERMLHQWSRLDVRAVRVLCAAGRPEPALLRAEASKGRLTAWLANAAQQEGARRALDVSRQRAGLEALNAWRAAGAGRCFLSLFATDDGLAVVHAADGGMGAVWLDEVRYQPLRLELFEPWERLVERSLDGRDPDARPLAGALAEHVLDRLGAWLDRAAPCLARGGTELVISAHRLFRNLPLLHARLPSGRRLSELFGAVRTIPGLADLARPVSADRRTPVGMAAFADPDGSLPFARIDGLLAMPPENIVAGPRADAAALQALLAEAGPLLLSAHGDFREDQPFHSVIATADGPFALSRFIVDRIAIRRSPIILGVCESGRSRRSVADEPIGFPTLLLHAGAGEVIAPCWRVDDFASWLFIGRLLEAISEGQPADAAVGASALWLRDLAAGEALRRLEVAEARIVDAGAVFADVLPRIERIRAWLQTLPPEEAPFHSPLDWAAFQLSTLGPVVTLPV